MLADSSNPKILVLKLGKAEPHLELRFRILSTPVAQAWQKMVQNSLENRGLKERSRFVNFSPDWRVEMEEKIQSVSDVIHQLAKIHPEITFGPLNFTNVQEEVNRLHVNFADRHLVYRDLTPESYSLWDAFNILLHQMESISRRRKIESVSGVKNAMINVSFLDSPRLNLGAEDFKEGVMHRNFGVCYLAYTQVGRHILELFHSQDTDVPNEHIQPFKEMSADFRIWFGHNQSHTAGRELEERIKNWFSQEGKSKFESVKLDWDCLALGIPEIPVAVLEEPIFPDHRILQLQDQIHRHEFLSDVQLLP